MYKMAGPEWKGLSDLPNFNNYPYEVSNLGDIRRVGKIRTLSKFRKKGNQGWFVTLCDERGKRRTIRLARVVCSAFYGYRNKARVGYKDEDPYNLHKENLYWKT